MVFYNLFVGRVIVKADGGYSAGGGNNRGENRGENRKERRKREKGLRRG